MAKEKIEKIEKEEEVVGVVGTLNSYFYPQHKLTVEATSKAEADKAVAKLVAKNNKE